MHQNLIKKKKKKNSIAKSEKISKSFRITGKKSCVPIIFNLFVQK